MKTEIAGKRTLSCDSCQSVLAEDSYYSNKRGSIGISLKNTDGDYAEHSYCSEECLKNHLVSRSESNKSIASEEKISFGRDGIVTLDFTKSIKDKKV